MALEAGLKLGNYEVVPVPRIVGVGEVYRARDTKLRLHLRLGARESTTEQMSHE